MTDGLTQIALDEDAVVALYVCAECLNVLDQDETACPMACRNHPGATRLWIEVPVPREVVREVVDREYGVTP